MVDLIANAVLARDSGFNLTGRLRHAAVKRLAAAWIPWIHFHERERFHPISLEALFTAPPAVFATLPEPVRDALRIEVGDNRVDPPVVRQGSSALGSGVMAGEALDDGPVGTGSVYTHGGGLHASHQFFGASDTISGLPDPTPGDPRAPRHPIAVIAEMRFLLETLKHELQAARPADALWGRFAVEDLFFHNTGVAAIPFPGSQKRAVLATLIDAFERGEPPGPLPIPLGWQLVQRTWDAVKGYAFLEYYFVYAFNDFSQYATLGNEHEIDVEGCCVVFRRAALDQLASGAITLDQVVAHTIITLVHKEFHNADELKRLPDDHDQARQELVVYVAPGSHATYLSEGEHDFFGVDDVVNAMPDWALLALGLTGLALPAAALLLLFGIVEHFVGPEDHTSDGGVSVGPGPAPEPGGTEFAKRLIVTPLSNIDGGANLYRAALAGQPLPDGLGLIDLARRAFPGQWGGTNGTIDQSDPWENATARYFRRFLQRGDIDSDVIP